MGRKASIRKDLSKYGKARKRISLFKNTYNISDREIIEALEEEIEGYRKKIMKQTAVIEELHQSIRQSKTDTVDITEDELMDKDVIEIESTTQYADGKTIKTTMKYKYKDDINKNIESERNIYSCGVDGGVKDYQTTSYYNNNGELIEEKTECLNDK